MAKAKKTADAKSNELNWRENIKYMGITSACIYTLNGIIQVIPHRVEWPENLSEIRKYLDKKGIKLL